MGVRLGERPCKCMEPARCLPTWTIVDTVSFAKFSKLSKLGSCYATLVGLIRYENSLRNHAIVWIVAAGLDAYRSLAFRSLVAAITKLRDMRRRTSRISLILSCVDCGLGIEVPELTTLRTLDATDCGDMVLLMLIGVDDLAGLPSLEESPAAIVEGYGN